MAIVHPVKTRVELYDIATKLMRAKAEALNRSALAEEADPLARRATGNVAAEIDHGCRLHAQYLAEYGSLGDALRASGDAE